MNFTTFITTATTKCHVQSHQDIKTLRHHEIEPSSHQATKPNLLKRNPPSQAPTYPPSTLPPQPPIKSHYTHSPYLLQPNQTKTQPNQNPTKPKPTTISKQPSQHALANMTPSRAPSRSTSTGAGVRRAIGPRVVRAIRTCILSDPTGAACEGSAERARTASARHALVPRVCVVSLRAHSGARFWREKKSGWVDVGQAVPG
jgi:hypothetical protein